MRLLARSNTALLVPRAATTHRSLKASVEHATLFTRRHSNIDSVTATKENAKSPDQASESSHKPETSPLKSKKKTMAELDEELKLKMESMSGGGGSAGVEYENGKAEGLKRGVKDNMFRVI